MKKTTPEAPETEVQEAQVVDAPTKEPEKPVADAGGFCVYLGPTIPGVIQSGTIYPGTLESVKALVSVAIQKHPLIERLIVKGETLAVDRIKVKTPGNRLYADYKKLAERPA